MSIFRARLLWLWRAWPFIISFTIITAHVLSLEFLPFPATLVNKVLGTALQVLGGLIVLHSIDGNLGLFKKQSLRLMFRNWVSEYPKRKVVVSTNLVVTNATALGAILTATAGLVPRSLEERVALLERRLEQAEQNLREQKEEVLRKVESVKTELQSKLQATSSELEALRATITESSVGGVKQQLFGVMLAIHGAIASAFA